METLLCDCLYVFASYVKEISLMSYDFMITWRAPSHRNLSHAEST